MHGHSRSGPGASARDSPGAPFAARKRAAATRADSTRQRPTSTTPCAQPSLCPLHFHFPARPKSEPLIQKTGRKQDKVLIVIGWVLSIQTGGRIQLRTHANSLLSSRL